MVDMLTEEGFASNFIASDECRRILNGLITYQEKNRTK